MKVMINGNPDEVSGEITVRELLAEKEITNPDLVSVEHNGTILRRAQFAEVRVRQNDRVEFLYFMGGGSTA